MTAIEVACPECDQQPYEPCIRQDGKLSPFTHAKRFEAASMCSDPPADPDMVKAAIDAAVGEIIG